MTEHTQTRRQVLRTGTAVGAVAVGLGATGSALARGNGNGKDKGTEFGRVYANDELWRTNVVKTLDDRPDPEDKIYFLHDGEKKVVARDDVSGQASPFVSESAPGDQDYNGGKWTHFSAKVTDVEKFDDNTPVANATDVLEADYIETSLGRPGFGPPNYFICPLNGRA